MNFPDFEKFVESLSSEKIAYIEGEFPSSEERLSSPEQVHDFIARVNSYFSLKMLRFLELYHKWLSEQLSDQS